MYIHISTLDTISICIYTATCRTKYVAVTSNTVGHTHLHKGLDMGFVFFPPSDFPPARSRCDGVTIAGSMSSVQ